MIEDRDCAWLYWCRRLTLERWREECRLAEERFSLFRPFAEAPFFGFRGIVVRAGCFESHPNNVSARRPVQWVVVDIDAWGNRTAQSNTGGSCLFPVVSVDTNNRLFGSPYQYDAAGDLTKDGFHAYTYDAAGRIAKVDGGATATYVYDAFGTRVEKTAGGSDSQYVYDQDGRMNTVFANGAFQRTYVYMDGEPVAEYFENTTYFVHWDHLESTRFLTRLDRTVRESDDYYPFGELIPSTPETGDINKFTGKETRQRIRPG